MPIPIWTVTPQKCPLEFSLSIPVIPFHSSSGLKLKYMLGINCVSSYPLKQTLALDVSCTSQLWEKPREFTLLSALPSIAQCALLSDKRTEALFSSFLAMKFLKKWQCTLDLP